MVNQPFKTTFTSFRVIFIAVTLLLIFFNNSAFAMQVSVATMVTNLSKAIPSLMQLVTAIGYVLGMFLVIKGLFSLKEYGEQRSASRSGSEQGGLTGALIMIVVGSALLFLPSSVQVGLSTFWSNPTPYAYRQDTTDSWAELINSVFMIVQLVGTIAFIRGLILLSSAGSASGRGQFGKAMAHIIGGILCINMYQFLAAVFVTLGLGRI